MLMDKSEGYNYTYVMIFLVHLQVHLSWFLKVQHKPGKQTINIKIIIIITIIIIIIIIIINVI